MNEWMTKWAADNSENEYQKGTGSIFRNMALAGTWSWMSSFLCFAKILERQIDYFDSVFEDSPLSLRSLPFGHKLR